MIAKLGTSAGQDIAHIVFLHPQSFGDLGYGIEEVVSAEKDVPFSCGKRFQKTVQRSCQFSTQDFTLGAGRRGDALGQLFQCKRAVIATSLFGRVGGETVQRKVTGDAGEPCSQAVRIFGWDGVPSVQPSIIDTLLRIANAIEDVFCNGQAVCAVFVGSFSDGTLIPGIVEGNDRDTISRQSFLIFSKCPSHAGPKTFIGLSAVVERCKSPIAYNFIAPL